MEALRELHPERPLWAGNDAGSGSGFDANACGPALRETLRAGATVKSLLEAWRPEHEKFREARKKYLLY